MKRCVIAAVARDENPYISEWVKHHLDLGFDEIRIYDNQSKVPLQTKIDKLPNEYRKRVFVEIEPISDNPQISSYQKALARYKDDTEWLAYFDIDEFIELEKPLSEVLDRRLSVGALFICWQFYNANGHEKYEDKPVVERFTQKSATLDNCKGKYIARPKDILAVGVHYPILVLGKSMVKVDGTVCYHANVTPVYRDMYIKHYYTKSYEEWLWKINRGSCDSRCLKKYNEFFWYNPDLQYLYNSDFAGLQMGYAHRSPAKINSFTPGL